MRKKYIILMFALLFSTVILIAAKWSTYTSLGSGNVATNDTFLILDVTANIQKQYSYGDLQSDLTGGNTTELQYNNNGVFAGIAEWESDGTDLQFDGSASIEQQSDISSGDALTITQADSDQELTASTGTQSFLAIKPEIAQSSSAGYSAIEVNVTESSTGSGTNSLLSLKVGGSEKFGVRNDGSVPIAGISDAVTFQDNGDSTKKLAFQLSGITASTTRTLTVPDANGTLVLSGSIDEDDMTDASDIVTDNICFLIDGGGSVITTGTKGYFEVSYSATIKQVTMLADQTGSIVVDIWKDTYANYPPDDSDTITASAVPTISSSNKSQDSTLSGWTTAITAGDILGYNVDSASTIEFCTICLKVEK